MKEVDSVNPFSRYFDLNRELEYLRERLKELNKKKAVSRDRAFFFFGNSRYFNIVKEIWRIESDILTITAELKELEKSMRFETTAEKVIYLRFFMNYSFKDISARLHLSERKIRKLIKNFNVAKKI